MSLNFEFFTQKTFGFSGDGNGPCNPPVSAKQNDSSNTKSVLPVKYDLKLEDDLLLIGFISDRSSKDGKMF